MLLPRTGFRPVARSFSASSFVSFSSASGQINIRPCCRKSSIHSGYKLRKALKAVPKGQRERWHGKCAESECLSRSYDAGMDPAGGTSEAVNIGDSGNRRCAPVDSGGQPGNRDGQRGGQPKVDRQARLYLVRSTRRSVDRAYRQQRRAAPDWQPGAIAAWPAGGLHLCINDNLDECFRAGLSDNLGSGAAFRHGVCAVIPTQMKQGGAAMHRLLRTLAIRCSHLPHFARNVIGDLSGGRSPFVGR